MKIIILTRMGKKNLRLAKNIIFFEQVCNTAEYDAIFARNHFWSIKYKLKLLGNVSMIGRLDQSASFITASRYFIIL